MCCASPDAVVEVDVNWLVDYCFQSSVGAKNHAVVMPDARMDATLKALVAAGFGAAGQKCTTVSAVIFVGSFNQWYFFLSSLCSNIISSHFGSFEVVVSIKVEV